MKRPSIGLALRLVFIVALVSVLALGILWSPRGSDQFQRPDASSLPIGEPPSILDELTMLSSLDEAKARFSRAIMLPDLLLEGWFLDKVALWGADVLFLYFSDHEVTELDDPYMEGYGSPLLFIDLTPHDPVEFFTIDDRVRAGLLSAESVGRKAREISTSGLRGVLIYPGTTSVYGETKRLPTRIYLFTEDLTITLNAHLPVGELLRIADSLRALP